MSRSQRLLCLIEMLRRHRWPVSGAKLAEELGVSLRTVYRDIRTLIEQGADIADESGLGYVLKPRSRFIAASKAKPRVGVG